MEGTAAMSGLCTGMQDMFVLSGGGYGIIVAGMRHAWYEGLCRALTRQRKAGEGGMEGWAWAEEPASGRGLPCSVPLYVSSGSLLFLGTNA